MSIENYVFSRSPDSEIPPIIHPVLSNNKNIVTMDRILGKGSYGTVYLCHDNNSGQEYAVKCIKSKKLGVPALMECMIMSSIYHPNLNSAIKISFVSKKIYILQELAISDLKVYRRKNIISEDICHRWIFMLIQAVYCLHSNNIIHGDIKASNVLVYDNRIKLTDFTLSTKSNWSNKHLVCTASHRPLEVWLGDKWDKKVDIWALGCTIYELIYGKNLFTSQNKDQSINALIDWYNYLPSQYKTDGLFLEHRDILYYSFDLPNSFNISSPINKLILSMLIIKSSDRPSINKILGNDLFDNTVEIPIIINTPETSIDPRSEIKIRAYINKLLSNNIVRNIAIILCFKTIGMINTNEYVRLDTCAWIAHKLFYRETISLLSLKSEIHEIIQMERQICKYLSFRLCLKSNDITIKEK